MAVIGGVALYLQGKKSVKKKTTETVKKSKTTGTPAPMSPARPRISKSATGSVATPAGRRSARIARKTE